MRTNENSFASFVLDLRSEFEWSSTLSYWIFPTFHKKDEVRHNSKHTPITIKAPLAFTDSKKVKLGFPVTVTFEYEHDDDGRKFMGFFNKTNDALEFHILLPGNMLNHLHLILLSNHAKMLHLGGTDLHYRTGKLSQVEISHKYDISEITGEDG